MSFYSGMVFLNDAMRMKQKQLNEMRQKLLDIDSGKQKTGLREDSSAESDPDEPLRMTESRIYIGLNDAETKSQKFDTGKYLGILKNVCQSYHVAFSVDIAEGGYYHEDGEYTEETSLILQLINTEKSIVQEIAKDLCAFFHQESVLVTENLISGHFISISDTET